MEKPIKQDPLHGVTLEAMLKFLHRSLGWKGLYDAIQINCFYNDPSIQSSLKFLRRTPWARAKLEKLYIKKIQQSEESP